jgi:hypothetical protein
MENAGTCKREDFDCQPVISGAQNAELILHLLIRTAYFIRFVDVSLVITLIAGVESTTVHGGWAASPNRW